VAWPFFLSLIDFHMLSPTNINSNQSIDEVSADLLINAWSGMPLIVLLFQETGQAGRRVVIELNYPTICICCMSHTHTVRRASRLEKSTNYVAVLKLLGGRRLL
jgi:hypothetical protein